jgi:hypothetical protein
MECEGEPTLLRFRRRPALRRVPHGPYDLFRAIGLMQGHTARDRAGLDGGKTGRVDHRQFGIVLATALRYVPPIDLAWQLDVGDQNIRDALLAPIQSLFSIARFDHVEAFIMQRLHDEFADEWVVLDEEYLHCQLLNTLILSELERSIDGAVPWSRAFVPSMKAAREIGYGRCRKGRR